jgi:hypothetical protein
MSFHSLVATAPLSLNTNGLVSYLQGLFGPLFLGIVGIVALFFLFTREIIRFVQFVVLAVAIAVIFYTPSIMQTVVDGIVKDTRRLRPSTRSERQSILSLVTLPGVIHFGVYRPYACGGRLMRRTVRPMTVARGLQGGMRLNIGIWRLCLSGTLREVGVLP